MKKIILFVIIAICLLISNSLLHSIYDLWDKRSVIARAQKQLEKEKQENIRLKKQLIQSSTKQFLEEEARNKLFLVKPNERQIVIPKELLSASASSEQKKSVQIPNWKKWFALFLP